MAWQGKIIGGTLGSMFGPWGAIAGAAAGHFFLDRKRQREALRQRQTSLAFLAGTLYRFATIDGPYQPKEEAVILAVLAEANGELGKCFPPQALRGLVDEARAIPDAAERLVSVTRASPDLAERLYFWFLRVAVSDGALSEQERGYLAQIAPPLGLSRETVGSIFRLFVPVCAAGDNDASLAADCRELGVLPSASAEEIKRAFREKSLKYHPDRHVGLDADMRELAAEKFSHIKAAYDRLTGMSSSAAPRFCKDPQTGGAVRGEPGDVVRCPVCGQLVRLPESFDPLSTRCPTCQVLLAQ